MDESIFRKKSLERISSPEALSDYLHVTSPAVWLILTAVILLLAGVLIWSSVTTIESYVSGTAEVKGGIMTIRFDDQQFAKNVETGMKVSTGNSETTLSSVGRDANGLYIATAHTALSDGFYPVQVSYKQTQILQLLFD